MNNSVYPESHNADTTKNEIYIDKKYDMNVVINEDDKDYEIEKEVASSEKMKAYAGMTKEDVLRFSNTSFLTKARFISILICWIALLALVITVIILTIVAPRCGPLPTTKWWQTAVFYQVYPKSFFDSDSDGVGDVKGITQKLDYLQNLGIEGLLLGSIFENENNANLIDAGYEITNHTNLDFKLSTLDDFKMLIDAAHERKIAIIIDFIPNFTGVNHTWFLESSQSTGTNNEFWNAYIWNTLVPNNWLNVYSNESAWQLFASNKYYFRNFLVTQPELNLRSSRINSELENILRYWLDLGVDGFRIVKSEYLVESADLQDEQSIVCTDNANLYSCLNHSLTKNQQENFDLFVRWRLILNEYSNDRILITNGRVNNEERVKYYGTGALNGVNLPANFLFDQLDLQSLNGINASRMINAWLADIPDLGSTIWMTSDEDSSRLRSKYGVQLMESMLVLRLSLPGVTCIYYGEEIGMPDISATPIYDPASQFGMGRDGYRAPFSWTNDSFNAGFSNSTSTWLSIQANEDPYNLQSQMSDKNSIYYLVQQLIKLRKDMGSLQIGRYVQIFTENDNILAFVREYDGFDRILVAMNLGTNITSTVNLRSSSIYIPYYAKLLFATSTWKDIQIGDDVNLESVKIYNRGEAIIASWPYQRP